ncbi:hypothetical protein DM02DRAFT_620653 [Periconia macrospinosa]|uniref:Uncharacterized protein n=1 Tax=Periconia macrospinosa TaxID=97972 RepID=A0A2V1D1R8_9PLEO|nr:hypothetical protein DM02DRAFT_620653 [Periconia macrospinosa]
MSSDALHNCVQSVSVEVRSQFCRASDESMQLRRPRSRQPPTSENIHARPHFMRPTANSSVRRSAAKIPPPLNPQSVPLSQPLGRRPPAAPWHSRRSNITATDPVQIASLWEKVMSYTTDTESSKGRRRAKPSSTTGKTTASASTSGQRWRQTPTASEASSVRPTKKPSAKVGDIDFVDTALEPCGITIQNKGVNKDLHKHFGLQESSRDPNRRLAAYKKELSLGVWLDPDLGRIQQEYKAMRVYECNEAEHSAYALRDIFLDEARHPWLPEEDGDQRWLPVRMLQLVRRLPQDEWLAPPSISISGKRYDWDIRPDCAYHVSLQAFQPGFRPSVRKHVSVVQKRAFCPYLTIEFKKDEQTLATARHQVAVASAIALFNRYRLKSCALQMSGRIWSEEDMSQMRHYGITFTGSSWDLWCTVPKTFETWTGCNMSTIYSGDCCILAGVQQLVSIMNDVHYWGLQVHGRSCKADIAAKIHSDPDADTNDITFLDD